MKVIGLIGGMSWESSLIYYKLVNEKVKEIKGGFASCKCLMYSVNFAEIEQLQHEENWEALNALMAEAALNLYKGGAEIIVLCTNTMHLCSPAITNAVPIPFLHIAEATGASVQQQNLSTVGLLGTNFTMEKEFYRGVLKEQFDIDTIIPNPEDRNVIHRIIYEELVKGEFKPASKEIYRKIIGKLQKEGAQGIILGCTEIPLLINENDLDLPAFDTTTIHAEAAVNWALSSSRN